MTQPTLSAIGRMISTIIVPFMQSLSAQLLQIVCPKLRMVLTSITQVNLILITIKNYILFGVSSHSYEIQGNRHVGDLWQPEILGGV